MWWGRSLAWVNVLDWHSFVLADTLRMVARFRNMWKFHTCHELYFIVFYWVHLLVDISIFGRKVSTRCQVRRTISAWKAKNPVNINHNTLSLPDSVQWPYNGLDVHGLVLSSVKDLSSLQQTGPVTHSAPPAASSAIHYPGVSGRTVNLTTRFPLVLRVMYGPIFPFHRTFRGMSEHRDNFTFVSLYRAALYIAAATPDCSVLLR
jgi:hypothetical protein